MTDKKALPLSLTGDSAVFQRVMRTARLVSATDTNVLIRGESGTGKELIARLIHEHSPRAQQPWVALNCAALPAELAEAQLFGYRRGAFTGAASDTDGFIQQANKGTLFLDEIGELSLGSQSKLLRFLEEGECQRIGDPRPQKLDVRVLAATNQALEERIREGSFRVDLYYRLNIIPIDLPPLRERHGDVPRLLKHFLATLSATHGQTAPQLSPDALLRLEQHDWPGNVRELRNVAERCVVFMPGQIITAGDLPDEWFESIRVSESELPIRLPSTGIRLADVEQDLITQALDRAGANRSHAAKLLGISRDALLYRLKKFGLV
ncbi:MAG: AAA family ATPase [Halomonadaceae bacterium]|nr:MAG: AAA family ATPase [Halomonadaceae bacterium]